MTSASRVPTVGAPAGNAAAAATCVNGGGCMAAAHMTTAATVAAAAAMTLTQGWHRQYRPQHAGREKNALAPDTHEPLLNAPPSVATLTKHLFVGH
jgi:hypothetical protein